MTNSKIIGILKEDLIRKCKAVNISIMSCPNAIKNTIDYTIVDLDTGVKEFLEGVPVGDNIHEATAAYDKIIGIAQRLINARCNERV